MYDAFTPVCGRITDVEGILYDDKWEWLEHYILEVQNADPNAAVLVVTLLNQGGSMPSQRFS